MRKLITLALLLLTAGAGLSAQDNQNALLFHLSGDKGLSADYSAGNPDPNFLSFISIAEDGAIGKAIRCADGQTLAYRAAGNIYAKRGTLSFFWRSGQEIYDVPFPIFRVSFADHSSWDMVWLRLDYNGHGFEGFVTDNNLVRVRIKKDMDKAPAKDEWQHLAFSWDENIGVRMYLNGEKIASRDTSVVLDTGLDQFGPHSRIISPYQVQSAYNMQRGGDIDELCIYSEMLPDNQIKELASGKVPAAAYTPRSLDDASALKEWKHYYGFDDATPPYLSSAVTSVRKIGILDAMDLKRWYWKANDGIVETTWPGVYNRSSIEGRNDYFQLPDWDCYFDSGKSVRFNMPGEPWNYLEITGGAFGEIGISDNADGSESKTVSNKEKGTRKTFHSLDKTVLGKTVTFTNVVKETPIQEFNAFNVQEGEAPQGTCRLSYSLTGFENFLDPQLIDVENYVKGRFAPEERSMMLALPSAANSIKPEAAGKADGLPIVHIVIPADIKDLNINIPLTLDSRFPAPSARGLSYTWNNMRGGLDGIIVELPALDVKAQSPGGLFPMNIRIKDPVWKLRDMLDFSFSVKPGEARTLWLDLRDRILPNDKPLYLTLAGSGADFNAEMLNGMKITLVFKPLDEARGEHIADRLTQIRDNHAMIVEEHTTTKRLDKYLQLEADFNDLFRVDPENRIGRSYWQQYHSEQVPPEYQEPAAPAGIPEWAFLQTELMKEYRKLAEWYMDNRQLENGEFGGGLSDDSDFTNMFVGMYAMGLIPDRIKDSISRMMEAFYDQGMLTNGISTIMTDGLHNYEEGMNVLNELNVIEQGNPVLVERLMQTAKTIREYVMGVNDAGHLHVRSNFYSATKMAEEGIWADVMYYAYYQVAPAMLLGDMYGNRYARETVLRFAESTMAHARTGANGKISVPTLLNFKTDEAKSWGWSYAAPHLWYSWIWTGDEKYRKAVEDSGWRTPLGTKEEQVRQLRSVLRDLVVNEYINTEGSLWTDRVTFSPDYLQKVRLGAMEMNRGSNHAPSNPVYWRFENESDAEKVGIIVTGPSMEGFEVEFFNTSDKPVSVEMKGMQIYGGEWEMECGSRKSNVDFGRGRTVKISIPARKEFHVNMKHTGPKTDYNGLTDLAICRKDIEVNPHGICVTVHNLSGKDSEETEVVLKDKKGKIVARKTLPAISAPNDLLPKTARITFDTSAKNIYSIEIDPGNKVKEIYKNNNEVVL